MAKTKNDRTELSKHVAGTEANFLAQYQEEDHSLEGMKEYVILPSLKVIQAMSEDSLVENFGVGAVILRPGDMLVVPPKDENFLFNPQFFGVEFLRMTDREDKEGEWLRTFDPLHEIALKARDSERREEPYPGDEEKPEKDQKRFRYVEVLRFYGVIYGEHPLTGTPVTLSFSKGEFGQGRSFCSALQMRKVMVDGKAVPAPLWSQIWSFFPEKRDKGTKKWWGLSFAPAGIIQPDEAEQCQAMHEFYKDAFANRKLMADGEQKQDGEKTPTSSDF